MKCWRCGKEVPEGSSTCVYCGSALRRPQPATPEGCALRMIYDQYGAELVLTNSAYLVNGVGDLLDRPKKLQNQLKMAADAGVLRLYREQLSFGAPDPSFDTRVRLLLSEEADLSDKAAAEIAGYFDEMIGWTRPNKEASSAGTGADDPAGEWQTQRRSTGTGSQWDSSGAAGSSAGTAGSSGPSGEIPGKSNSQPQRAKAARASGLGLVRLVAIVAGAAAALYLIVTLALPGSNTSSGNSSAGSASDTSSSSDAGGSSSGTAQTQESPQETGLYALTVSGGTILLADGEELTDLGSSCELEEGQKFILMPDPDDRGYNFREWSITDASGETLLLRKITGMYQDENGKYYSCNIMPAQAVKVEAVLDPWVLIDWMPVLDDIDGHFTYDGRDLAAMEKSDWLTLFEKKGLPCYTEENGKRSVAKYVNWYVADSAGSGGSCYWSCEVPNVLDCSMEMIFASDVLLPDTCPVRMGDTYAQVCAKLGASEEMAETLRTLEEQAEASRVALKEHYYAADYQLSVSLESKQDGRETLFLGSRLYRYQFWFDADGGLYHIAIFDNAG